MRQILINMVKDEDFQQAVNLLYEMQKLQSELNKQTEAEKAARIILRPNPGERLRLTGWPIYSEGRKHHAGSVMHDAEGQVVAVGRALWVSMPAD